MYEIRLKDYGIVTDVDDNVAIGQKIMDNVYKEVNESSKISDAAASHRQVLTLNPQGQI